MDPREPEKATLPLIPQSLLSFNQDTSALLREIFQDVLDEPKLPENVAQNWITYNVDSERDKQTGEAMQNMLDTCKLEMRSIQIAEEKLAIEMKTSLERERLSDANPQAKEFKRLKRYFLFPNIDKNDVKEYKLITPQDLLPTRIRQKFDFTYDRWSTNLERPTLKLPHIQGDTKVAKKQDVCKTATLCRGVECVTGTTSTTKQASVVHVNPDDFRLDTHTVAFRHYRLKVTYKQRFHLQNVSNRLQRIFVPEPRLLAEGAFIVNPQFNAKTFRLCPGMRVAFVVTFKTNVYVDSEDYYEVNGLRVRLLSRSHSPYLSGYIKPSALPPQEPVRDASFSAVRAEALNNSIDCGACFVGEQIRMQVVLKNTGGMGRFFMMTEEQWKTLEVDVFAELQLSFGVFNITPNYFELDTNDFIVLEVDVYGAHKDTFVEHVYMLCDNNTWVCIDFIADVIIFDEYTVTIDKTSVIRSEREVVDAFFNLFNSPNLDDIPTWGPILFSTDGSLSKESSQDVDSVSDSLDQSKSGLISPSLQTMRSSVELIDEVIFEYLLQLERQQMPQMVADNSGEEQLIQPDGIAFLGRIIGNGACSRTVTMYNNSMIELKCRWEMAKIEPQNYLGLDVRNLDFECFSMSNHACCLPAYGNIATHFHAKPFTNEEAFYGLSLNFIVEGLPACAVRRARDNPNFVVLQPKHKQHSKEIVDVQVMSIDVVCFVYGLKIYRTPSNIFGTKPQTIGTTLKRHITLHVVTEFVGKLNGRWVSNDHNTVMVYPEEFTLMQKVPMTFEVEYLIDSFESHVEQICVVIEDVYRREIDIPIEIEAAHLRFNRSILDFGHLFLGNTYARKVNILNVDQVALDWRIHEQYQRESIYHGKNLMEIHARNLECGDVQITYCVKCVVPANWTSRLILFTVHDDVKVEECQLIVKYQVLESHVCIHSDYSPEPTLTPPEALHVGCAREFVVCVHNHGPRTLSLTANDLRGDDACLVDMAIKPSTFTIPSMRTRRVNIVITPSAAGCFDQLFVPFCINDTSPFRIQGPTLLPSNWLTVTILVEDICVRVQLPREVGHFTTVIWPPMVDDVSCKSLRAEDDEAFNNAEETEQRLDVTLADEEMDTLPVDLVQYLRSLEETRQRPMMEASTATSTRSSFSSDTTISDTISCYPRASGFANVSPHILEVCGVPVRRVHTVRIHLENVTPVRGEVLAVITNFAPNDYQPTRIQNVLRMLGACSVEEAWEKRLGPHGIAIQTNTDSAGAIPLQPFGKANIELTIYANTWGVYKEDLIIEFNNILPLRITAIIEVVGIPLEFPIGKNNIHRTPILRFGTLAYKSSFEMRQLLVHNFSTVPVMVVWHIFMRHTHAELAEQPITVLFDIYHPDDDDIHEEESGSQGNLMITHGKCVGKSDHRIFKLYPQEMHIKAKETIAIKLGVNTNAFAASYEHQEIEAYLIGYVYVAAHLRHVPELYQRPTGHENEPAKAKLTATLELPVLTLSTPADELHFAVFTDQVLANKACTLYKRHLTFYNAHQAAAQVRFSIDAPFMLENDVCACPLPDCDAIVAPGACAKLVVRYAIGAGMVRCLAKCLVAGNVDGADEHIIELCEKLDAATHTCELLKHLHIKQAGFVRQTVPVLLKIYFPRLAVTNELDFGHVYIGNVAKRICTVKNYSLCRVEFTLVEGENFHAVTKCGVIGPGSDSMPNIYDFAIAFIPQMKCQFQEKIILHTQIPNLHYTITVRGIGTYDEQYYKPDTC